VTNS